MARILWYVRSDNSIGDRVQEPADFLFMNRGIFLTLDDSPLLDAPRAYALLARESVTFESPTDGA